jgi:hypothetical protein
MPDPTTVPADKVNGYVALLESFRELQKKADEAYDVAMDYYIAMMKDTGE